MNSIAAGSVTSASGRVSVPDARILYIHPHNHFHNWVVPIGAVGAANLLPRPPVGRFAFEVTPEDLQVAEVVLLGVHWFFPIGVLDHMIAAIRHVNPAAQIVVGGLTASFYGEDFTSRFPVDYVCTGDVELSFPSLIEHLLAGESPPPLPNVIPRGGAAPANPRRLSQEEFDRIDWLRIDWFPSYHRWVAEQHAKYRADEIRDGIYPTLPLTRGCVRPCSFCFGAYQRRVFGPRVLLRSPVQLVRDLGALAADPALRFVTLMFAEGCYLRYFADALDGLRVPLDAHLMFCGTVDHDVLDKVRSGFAGSVYLLTIPPDELAPLRRDHAGPERDAQYARLVDHFKEMANTRTLVYYVARRPAAREKTSADDRVSFASGEDWVIRRPNLDDLGPERDFKKQLNDLVGVAKQTATLHLLRAVVPALRKTLNPELDTETFLSPEFTAGSGPFEVHIHRMLLNQLRKHGVVGYSEVQLRWFACRALPDLRAAWVPPCVALDGDCTWDVTLNGFGWRGRAVLPHNTEGKTLWIVPAPLVRAGGEELAVETWIGAQLPAVPVKCGAPREVEVGGETRGEDIFLWVIDGSTRREWLLSPPIVAPSFADVDWPSLDMALALLGALISRPVPRGLGWTVGNFALSRKQLSLEIASATRSAGLALFPRTRSQNCPGTRTVGCQLFGPGGGDLARDREIEQLQDVIVRLVAGVERTFGNVQAQALAEREPVWIGKSLDLRGGGK